MNLLTQHRILGGYKTRASVVLADGRWPRYQPPALPLPPIPVPHAPLGQGGSPDRSALRGREHNPVGTARVHADVLGESEGDEVRHSDPAPRALGLGLAVDKITGLDDLLVHANSAARKIQAIRGSSESSRTQGV